MTPGDAHHDPAVGTVRLCLAGDVMCGRGIDQILKHPGDPTIHEDWLSSALSYVELAEAHSGTIPRLVNGSYVWGDALEILDELAPDVTIVNLETAITDRGHPWPGKAIQYRMNPANVDVLTAAGIDVVALANNHVLDWSAPGLEQTLDVLDEVGIAVAGAGRTSAEAWTPAMVQTSNARVVVFAVGSTTSGIPVEWAADEHGPGVALLEDLSDRSIDRIAQVVDDWAGPQDMVVLSVHWGSNWGYEIPADRRRFARRVIERSGVHVVHGHSSHHPLGIEIHEGSLILHGCGDLVTDYEGISGHERFRGELGGLYSATIEPDTGTLQRLEIVPTKVERFRLTRPSSADVRWLASVLDTQGRMLRTRVRVGAADHLVVDW